MPSGYGSAVVDVGASSLGNSLQDLLIAQEIRPGDAPGYTLCKQIYAYHPIGGKMADSPIAMAQSQARDITIPGSPEDRVREKFIEQWALDGADNYIFNTASLSRVYGIAAVAALPKDLPPDEPIDYFKLANRDISFNVLDPLNTAGSLVLNQDPNSPDFQKVLGISIAGTAYHRSRACVIMNEGPLYIEYVPSAYGFSGRSVYQRGLLPLKSFVQTMVTDDMVTRKCGLLVAMIKQAGSIANNAMVWITGVKRRLLKEGENNNILSIGHEDKIESIDMKNLEGPLKLSRTNILENLALSADMPAKILNAETFAEGFGEGTEDAKNIARYVDRIRIKITPLYTFFDKIIQHRAWTPEFYKTIQDEYPEQYGSVSYKDAFYQWVTAFKATWPSLLIEPESEKVKTDDVKLKALIATVQVLIPEMDPINKAIVFEWFANNLNENKVMFKSPLILDIDALAAFSKQNPMAAGGGDDGSEVGGGDEGAEKEPGMGHPFAAQDNNAASDEPLRRPVTRRDVERIVERVMSKRDSAGRGPAPPARAAAAPAV